MHTKWMQVLPGENDPFGEVLGGTLRIACTGMVLAQATVTGEVILQDASEDSQTTLPLFRDSLDEKIRPAEAAFYLLPFISGETGHRFRVHGDEWTQPGGIHVTILRLTGIWADVDTICVQRKY